MVQSKFLLKNSMWFFSFGIVSRAIPFLLIPVYTGFLSPEDYGILAICISLAGVVSIFNTLGIVKFGGRVLVRFHNKGKMLSLLLGNIYGVSLIFAFAISIFLSFLCTPLKAIFFGSVELPSRLIVILPIWTSFFLCISGILQTCQTVLHKGKLFFFINSGKVLLLHTLKVFVLVCLKLGIVGFLAAELVTEFFIASISVYAFVKIIQPKFDATKKNIIKMAFQYGIPFVPSKIGGWFQRYIDRLLMARFIGMWDVGLYSFAFAFAESFSLIWFPFRQGISPAFIKKLDRLNENPNAIAEYSEYTTFFFSLSCFVGLAIALYSQEVIALMANERFQHSYNIVPMFVLVLIFQNAREIFDVPITLKFKTWFFPMRTLTGAGISVTANILLIPLWGVFGAASALLLTNIILLFCTVMYGQRLMRIPYNFPLMVVLVALAFTLFSTSKIFALNLLWMSLFKFFLTGVFLLFSLFLMKRNCPLLTSKVVNLLPQKSIYSSWLKNIAS